MTAPINDARLIAELQAVTIGIHLVGLDRLPEMMSAGLSVSPAGYFPKENGPIRLATTTGGET